MPSGVKTGRNSRLKSLYNQKTCHTCSARRNRLVKPDTMTKRFLLFFATACSLGALAQKTEITANVSAGLFRYGGKLVGPSTSVYTFDNGQTGIPYNNWGSRPDLFYSLGLKMTKARQNGFLSGFGLSYEHLRGNIAVNEVVDESGFILHRYPANGNVHMITYCATLTPYAGRRLKLGTESSLDLTGGIDLAYNLHVTKKIDAKAEGINSIKSQRSYDTRNLDCRPAVNARYSQGRLSLYLGYSFGILNQNAGELNGRVYTRILQLGCGYRL